MEEGALEALLSIVAEQIGFPQKTGVGDWISSWLSDDQLVLAVLCCAGAFEGVDDAGNGFDCWD